MGFTVKELERIQAIRDINNDQSIDSYECLETYYEMMEGYDW